MITVRHGWTRATGTASDSLSLTLLFAVRFPDTPPPLSLLRGAVQPAIVAPLHRSVDRQPMTSCSSVDVYVWGGDGKWHPWSLWHAICLTHRVNAVSQIWWRLWACAVLRSSDLQPLAKGRRVWSRWSKSQLYWLRVRRKRNCLVIIAVIILSNIIYTSSWCKPYLYIYDWFS